MTKLEAILWLLVFMVLWLLLWLAQPVIMLSSILCALFGKGKVQQWGVNCWEGEDNKASAQLGGDPDESISSRLGKARKKGSGWTIIANKLDLVAYELFGDVNHCDNSIERDEGRKQVTTH